MRRTESELLRPQATYKLKFGIENISPGPAKYQINSEFGTLKAPNPKTITIFNNQGKSTNNFTNTRKLPAQNLKLTRKDSWDKWVTDTPTRKRALSRMNSKRKLDEMRKELNLGE